MAMTIIPMVSTHSVAHAWTDDQSLKVIALLSCLGLAATLCVVGLGVDLSAGWV